MNFRFSRRLCIVTDASIFRNWTIFSCFLGLRLFVGFKRSSLFFRFLRKKLLRTVWPWEPILIWKILFWSAETRVMPWTTSAARRIDCNFYKEKHARLAEEKINESKKTKRKTRTKQCSVLILLILLMLSNLYKLLGNLSERTKRTAFDSGYTNKNTLE